LDIRNQGTEKWQTVSHWQLHEDVTALGFTPDESGLWLLSNKGRDRIALVQLDLASGVEKLVHEDPEVDIEAVFIGPQTQMPMATLSYPDYPFTQALNSRVKEGLEKFKIQTHQGLEILSMDDREALWTVRVFDDRGAYYFLYRQENGEIIALGKDRFDPENHWAAAVKPIALKSRDGLPLKGYLTRPRGAIEAPAPMVLLVHGGPWSRDYWGYDEMVQFLANRGYAVLQINYRGSEGYGRKFKEAAVGEFSGKMHTDLVDAVKWAVDQGIADPSAIAIVGGSYGGYASLVGLTHTPELFACGVAINGVADIGHFVKRLPSNPPPTLRAGISTWHRYVAHPDADQAEKVFERISPLYHAGKLTKPVMIIFGERDSRVSPEQSEMMIKELKRLQKPVRSIQFMNEGHGITRMDNTCEMFQALEEFLGHHLGGRRVGAESQANRS
jgi:dipeptidyl aminopeptidase/acylaminoacyl peptidase